MRFELGSTTILQSLDDTTTITNEKKNKKRKKSNNSTILNVQFPFDRLYREQYDYMVCVKEALELGGHCVLEMPAASGTTECLISLVLSLPKRRKLVYAINPLPKMKRVLEDIQHIIIQTEQKQQKEPNTKDDMDVDTPLSNNTNFVKSEQQQQEQQNSMSSVLVLCLTSHDQELLDESHRQISIKNEKRNINNPSTLSGIYSNLEELIHRNKHSWSCTNSLIQYAIANAHILVVQYQYVLDSKVSKLISCNLLLKQREDNGDAKMEDVTSTTVKSTTSNGQHKKKDDDKDNNEEKSDTIIVFDQAHNIDSVCLDTLSVALNSNCLDQATKSLANLKREIERYRDVKQHQHQNATINAAVTPMEIDSGHSINNINNETHFGNYNATIANNNALDDEYQSLANSPIDYGIFFDNNDYKTKMERLKEKRDAMRNNNNHDDDNVAGIMDDMNDTIEKHPAAAAYIHSNDLVYWEPVPGNIRRAEHFIGFLRKIIEYYKLQLRWIKTEINKANKNANNNNNNGKKKDNTKDNNKDSSSKKNNDSHVRNETPLAFLHRMTYDTGLEAKALKFTYVRLVSLLQTLDISRYPMGGGREMAGYSKLLAVADLTSLFATYTSNKNRLKFAILTELNHPSAVENANTTPSKEEYDSKHLIGEKIPTLQLACLDASVALSPLLERFRTVILTSTTLSPIQFYPKLLSFEPRIIRSFEMSSFQPCVCPMVISRGSDQLVMSTKYADRAQLSVVRNYGSMLVELCSVIPDGVVAYFTSYSYMESLIQEWDAMGIMRELTKSKIVFIETLGDLERTTVTLDNFRLACDKGRGGVFFAIARGKVSESIAFDSHYGRAAIMFGLPFAYTLSNVLRARVEYGKVHLKIREQDYLSFDAVRQTSKCLANTLRSKMTDYSILILADARFNLNDKKSKLPSWILQFLPDHQLNLSTENATSIITNFLRHMGQPVAQGALRNILLTNDDLKFITGQSQTSATLKTKPDAAALSSATMPEGAVSSSSLPSVPEKVVSSV